MLVHTAEYHEDTYFVFLCVPLFLRVIFKGLFLRVYFGLFKENR